MIIKFYDAKKIGQIKFDSFYRKIVSTLARDLSDAGFNIVCGDMFRDKGKELTGYLERVLTQAHASIPIIEEVENMIKKEFSTRHMTYHHHSGSTVVIFDKPEDFDKEIYGDIKIWGDENRVGVAKAGLDKLAEKDFSIEEKH